MTEEEKQIRIRELWAEKAALLDKFGVFGGGEIVRKINEELESLGIDENY